MLTPDEAVRALNDLDGGPEADHRDAGKILLQVVPPKVAAAYERAETRDLSWWWG